MTVRRLALAGALILLTAICLTLLLKPLSIEEPPADPGIDQPVNDPAEEHTGPTEPDQKSAPSSATEATEELSEVTRPLEKLWVLDEGESSLVRVLPVEGTPPAGAESIPPMVRGGSVTPGGGALCSSYIKTTAGAESSPPTVGRETASP